MQPAVTERTTLHRGKKFDFEMLTVARPSGRVLQREIVRHPGAVVVVPVLSTGRSKEVVLIRNYRIAVERPLVECCAGTIERERTQSGGFGKSEDPALCARRELIEETGYRAGKLSSLGPGWFYTTPGLTDEQMFAFLAEDLEHVGQKLEEDESIEVVRVPAHDAVRMAVDGTIRDAKSMLAILLAQQAGAL